MTTPIIESIAENLKTAIAGVTVANGYNQTLTPIRPKRNDFSDVSPIDGTALIWQENDEPVGNSALTTTTFAQEFLIMCVVLDSDAATASIDTRLNQVKSDIRKAIMIDPTRGGLAIDTQIGPSRKFDDGEGYTGIAVTCIVIYRTGILDPYFQI
jgi:hypothetical protein